MPLPRKRVTPAAAEQATFEATNAKQVARQLEDIVILTGSRENAISTLKLKIKYAADDNLSDALVKVYADKLNELLNN